jgi:hypothetical protein
MYATVRSYAGAPGLADELVKHEDEVRALITGIAGFRAYHLIKTGDGAVSVSVYEDQAGAEESTRKAREWMQQTIPDLSVSPPEVSAGDVVIQAASEARAPA